MVVSAGELFQYFQTVFCGTHFEKRWSSLYYHQIGRQKELHAKTDLQPFSCNEIDLIFKGVTTLQKNP